MRHDGFGAWHGSMTSSHVLIATLNALWVLQDSVDCLDDDF